MNKSVFVAINDKINHTKYYTFQQSSFIIHYNINKFFIFHDKI